MKHLKFILLAALALLLTACPEGLFDPDEKDTLPPTEKPDDKPSDKTEEKMTLQETTKSIEDALKKGDSKAFLEFFDGNTLGFYKEVVEENKEKLKSFNDVFKTRKLVHSTPIYAVYEVKYEGMTFEISMTLDNDGEWKIKDM